MTDAKKTNEERLDRIINLLESIADNTRRTYDDMEFWMEKRGDGVL